MISMPCRTAFPDRKSYVEHITDRADIIGITNGIHIPTWEDDNMLLAAEKTAISGTVIEDNKMKLIEFVKARTGIELDLNTLLIGFARYNILQTSRSFIQDRKLLSYA